MTTMAFMIESHPFGISHGFCDHVCSITFLNVAVPEPL